MDRFNNLLNGVQNSIEAAQKTYKGQKRSDLKDSDFLFPETRSFPIVTPQDVPDAISNYGRMKGQMTYEAFLRKLYNKIKNKPEFIAALPEASKEQLGIKKSSKAYCKIKAGDKVRNVNTACMHYGSEGIVDEVEPMPDNIGYVVAYTATNDGPTWKPGEMLRKTHDQLSVLETLPKTLVAQDEDMEMEEDEEDEDDSPEHELMEYKSDFFEMSVGSLRAIATHATEILNSLENPRVKENLTESWLQGKIAVTEDYMRTIHDFIMYVSEAADTISAADRPGLWENIRRKKQREGKNYKPAKPGDKDRPDSEQWKRLQQENK